MTSLISAQKLKNLAGALGVAVTLASLFFVGIRLFDRRVLARFSEVMPEIGIATLAAGLVYGGIIVFLTLAWWRLQGQIDFLTAHRIFGRSQLAKYIPGNIFHFAVRHSMGYQAAIKHGDLAAATFFEVISLMAAAATVAFLGSFAFSLLGEQAFIEPETAFFAALAVLLAAFLAVNAARRLPFVASRLGRFRASQLMASYSLHLIFFTLGGVILYGLLSVLLPVRIDAPIASVIGCSATAWLAGFVTPGASAGLGVREACLTLLLTPLVGTETAALAAITYRFSTTLGDLFYFAVASRL